MNESVDGIEEFVREVLENEFPHESFKHKPTKTSKGLRFHCPYCGDTSDLRKTPRGNLYMKTRRYRCFNDGCFTSVSLESFISKFVGEYGIDISGIDLSEVKAEETNNQFFNDLLLTKDNNIYDYLDDMDLISKLPHIDDLKTILSLRDVNTLDPNSKTYKFLYDRAAFAIPNLSTRVYADSLDENIFIMNVDDFTNRILSYAIRNVHRKSYIIQVYSDFFKFWNPPESIEEDHIEFLDMISSYFNIMNVDFTEDVNVTEGQFDAMFLENHMALQGVSKMSFILNHINSDKINILFDMDKGGYATVTRYMDMFGVFLWSSLIDKIKRTFYKDLIDVKKIHDINELFKFLYFKSGRTFTFNQFNELVNKYISKEPYDRFFI